MNPVIRDDIRRYKKNKFAGNFALLALVFNCFYFMLLYAIHESQMKTVLIGVSVITNLVVLLSGFYASEGVKGYNKKFSIVLFVLAAVQIARIFIYPTMGMAGNWLHSEHIFGFTTSDIKTSVALNGTLMIIFLAASAACFIVAGVFGLIFAQRLEVFSKKVADGEISIEETLAQLNLEDAKAAEVKEEAQKDLTEAGLPVSGEEVDNG